MSTHAEQGGADKDRRSKMAHSTVKGPAKKNGAGGHYTWGRAGDVTDFDPKGVQSEVKVTTTRVPSDASDEFHDAIQVQGEVPNMNESNFPSLAAAKAVKGGSQAGSTSTVPRPVPSMDVVNLGFGCLLSLGGLIAFLRKGSLPSLLGGGSCGAALAGSSILVSKNAKDGHRLGAFVAALLALGMLPRVVKTKKMMPAGVVTLLGLLAAAYNAVQLLQLAKQGSGSTPAKEG
mmetsp:Transcript_51733/g.123125  ORF Transcript_51733/g.123125 Transcript_51733/m.123125 type:complete len:232 (+) Transcript_51733:84-779(+)